WTAHPAPEDVDADDPVAGVALLRALPQRSDLASGARPQDVRHGEGAVRAGTRADLTVQRAVHGDGPHPQQHLAWPGRRLRYVLHPQHLGSAVLVEHHCLHEFLLAVFCEGLDIMTSDSGTLTPDVTRVSLPKASAAWWQPSTLNMRRSTIAQSSTLFI